MPSYHPSVLVVRKGWGRPGSTLRPTKFHYFINGRSLCGKHPDFGGTSMRIWWETSELEKDLKELGKNLADESCNQCQRKL